MGLDSSKSIDRGEVGTLLGGITKALTLMIKHRAVWVSMKVCFTDHL